MTTLSQGLVKLLYFPDGFRPGVAKIRQTLIAQYALDKLVCKDDQLHRFLNIAYLGHKDGRAIHGLADASRSCFGTREGQEGALGRYGDRPVVGSPRRPAAEERAVIAGRQRARTCRAIDGPEPA